MGEKCFTNPVEVQHAVEAVNSDERSRFDVILIDDFDRVSERLQSFESTRYEKKRDADPLSTCRSANTWGLHRPSDVYEPGRNYQGKLRTKLTKSVLASRTPQKVE